VYSLGAGVAPVGWGGGKSSKERGVSSSSLLRRRRKQTIYPRAISNNASSTATPAINPMSRAPERPLYFDILGTLQEVVNIDSPGMLRSTASTVEEEG
jgi:hypothetical protein